MSNKSQVHRRNLEDRDRGRGVRPRVSFTKKMDTDLLAFVTGLDPKEAEEVAYELDPGLKKKSKQRKGGKEPIKKVAFSAPLPASQGFDTAGLADFTSVLADETAFSGLKRRLGAIADAGELAELGIAGGSKRGPKAAQVVETPLPRVQQDRIERQVAYTQTAKDMSKWQPIVQKNRQAESLSFPLNGPPALASTNASIAASHTARTEFEREIEERLASAGLGNEAEISRFEEMAMNHLSAKEVEARFKELAKKRALLFFQDRKTKHQAKIKSKKFRKIKSKEKAREAGKREAELTPEERREKAELARAKERLTLKTRRANKWAQEMIHRCGLEPGSRQEIVEQLRDKERLRQEIFGRAKDARDGSEDEAELYLSGSEDDPDQRLNQDYFQDSEDEDIEEEEASEDGSAEGGEDSCDEEAAEDAIIGRRTFGKVGSEKKAKTDAEDNVESLGEEYDELQRTVKPTAKKTSGKKKPSRDSLFQLADDDKLRAQQEIIRQAFAQDDELFREFAAEKEAIVQADAPQVEDMTLPGWGNWAGDGVAVKEPRVRILRTTPGGIEAKRRRDANLKNVIINEKQNKKLQASWMVPKVPHPYRGREEYERARVKPLGPEWNSVHSYKKRIQPRVQVKVGSIIDAIKFVKQPKHH